METKMEEKANKFTPGPWSVSDHIETRSGENKRLAIMARVGPVRFENVAMVWSNIGPVGRKLRALGFITPEQSVANASLIAAAPDLYAACEAMLNYFETNGTLQEEREARKLARAALAKATPGTTGKDGE